MVNAQEWLDKEYPKQGKCLGKYDTKNKGKKREEITDLDIESFMREIGESRSGIARTIREDLEGSLKLERFANLKKLDCYDNDKLTHLDLSQCRNLETLYC